MKKEWQIIDFNNYEDKLRKLVAFGDSLESKIKVNKWTSDDFRMKDSHRRVILAI